MRSLFTEFLLEDAVEKYSPDELRDDHGRWTGSASGASSSSLLQRLKNSISSKGATTLEEHAREAKYHRRLATTFGAAALAATVAVQPELVIAAEAMAGIHSLIANHHEHVYDRMAIEARTNALSVPVTTVASVPAVTVK